MPARSESEPKDFTANLVFEATALRSPQGTDGSRQSRAEQGKSKVKPARQQPKQSNATPQVLSKAKSNTVTLARVRFHSTQIPVCLWFFGKNKAAAAKRGFRDRRQQTFFIAARKLGTRIDRVHRELTDADLEKITSTHHAWRGAVGVPPSVGFSSKDHLKAGLQPYADLPGFCKSATTAGIAAYGHVLTPGRKAGAGEVEDDGDPFEEKMPRPLLATLHDTLLPKLLSGKLNAAEVESKLEANA